MVETRDLTADGTDYSLSTTTVNVPANGMAPVTVSATDDGADESSEEFEISIPAMTGIYITGKTSKATVYIKNKYIQGKYFGNDVYFTPDNKRACSKCKLNFYISVSV